MPKALSRSQVQSWVGPQSQALSQPWCSYLLQSVLPGATALPTPGALQGQSQAVSTHQGDLAALLDLGTGCRHSDRVLTFTGDTVGQQLVAHKAGADYLVPRVTALLLTGPATCHQSQRERGQPHPEVPWLPSFVWARPQKLAREGGSPEELPAARGDPQTLALGTAGV